MHARIPDRDAAAGPLAPAELARYERQIRLPEIGAEGQARIRAGRVLVVGAGGLGSPAAIYLAAAGVGRLTLLDHDRVERSNLHRQILFDDEQVGRPKAEVARDRLTQVNPHVEVESHEVRLDESNASDWISGHDVVIDGSDNFATRFALNDAAARLGVPLVSGSLERFRAQVSVFCTEGGPCYRCLYREPPPPGRAPSCAEAGVLGVLPGAIGTLQAAEALKILAGAGTTLAGRLLLVDMLEVSFREIKIPQDPDCPVCGENATSASSARRERRSPTAAHDVPVEVAASELAPLLRDGRVSLLDVRTAEEWASGRIAGAEHIPLSELAERVGELDPNGDWVAYCHVGQRSYIAAQMLRAAGVVDARSLAGGIVAWTRFGEIES